MAHVLVPPVVQDEGRRPVGHPTGVHGGLPAGRRDRVGALTRDVQGRPEAVEKA